MIRVSHRSVENQIRSGTVPGCCARHAAYIHIRDRHVIIIDDLRWEWHAPLGMDTEAIAVYYRCCGHVMQMGGVRVKQTNVMHL